MENAVERVMNKRRKQFHLGEQDIFKFQNIGYMQQLNRMFQQRFNVLLSNIDLAGGKQPSKPKKQGALINLIKKRILESAAEYKHKQQQKEQKEKRTSKRRKFGNHMGRRLSKDISASSHSSEDSPGSKNYFSHDDVAGKNK